MTSVPLLVRSCSFTVNVFIRSYSLSYWMCPLWSDHTDSHPPVPSPLPSTSHGATSWIIHYDSLNPSQAFHHSWPHSRINVTPSQRDGRVTFHLISSHSGAGPLVPPLMVLPLLCFRPPVSRRLSLPLSAPTSPRDFVLGLWGFQAFFSCETYRVWEKEGEWEGVSSDTTGSEFGFHMSFPGSERVRRERGLYIYQVLIIIMTTLYRFSPTELIHQVFSSTCSSHTSLTFFFCCFCL